MKKLFYILFILLTIRSYSINYPMIYYTTPSTLATGVYYQHAYCTDPKWSIEILRVNINKAEVVIKPAISLTGYPTPVSSIALYNKAIAAVNGGFFSSNSTLSLIQIDGKVLKLPVSSKPARAAFGITHRKTMTIQKVSSDLATVSGFRWSDVYQGLGGGPNLITNGALDITTTEEGFDDNSGLLPDTSQPRTALGFNTTGQLIIVVVDGLQETLSIGMTLLELAQFFQDLGADYAMNLDGGGSSTFVLGRNVINRPSDGFERPVLNALLVIPNPTIPK